MHLRNHHQTTPTTRTAGQRRLLAAVVGCVTVMATFATTLVAAPPAMAFDYFAERTASSYFKADHNLVPPTSTLFDERANKVCFENPLDANASARQIIQDAIESTWNDVTALDFHGWEQCTPWVLAIRVRLSDTIDSHVAARGADLIGIHNGITINTNPATDTRSFCAGPEGADYCLRARAVHEFSMAMGFASAPGALASGCETGRDQRSDLMATHDPASITNFCAQNWQPQTTLSALDVLAARHYYGPWNNDTPLRYRYSMRLLVTDHDNFSPNEFGEIIETDTYELTETNRHLPMRWVKCVDDEVRAEVAVNLNLYKDVGISNDMTTQLFEGDSCDTEDHENFTLIQGSLATPDERFRTYNLVYNPTDFAPETTVAGATDEVRATFQSWPMLTEDAQNVGASCAACAGIASQAVIGEPQAPGYVPPSSWLNTPIPWDFVLDTIYPVQPALPPAPLPGATPGLPTLPNPGLSNPTLPTVPSLPTIPSIPTAGDFEPGITPSPLPPVVPNPAPTEPSTEPPTDSTPAPAPATEKRCAGRLVTVDLSAGQTPTNGNDVILGTSGDDVINGRGGRDIICGGHGKDVIRGGAGRDIVHGGGGRDRIFGGGANDTLMGQAGPDVVNGGAGNDHIVGGVGNDLCRGNAGSDTLAPTCERRRQ